MINIIFLKTNPLYLKGELSIVKECNLDFSVPLMFGIWASWRDFEQEAEVIK